MLSPAGVLFRSARPVIAVATTAVALLLGLAIGLDSPRLLVLALVVLTSQAAIGLSGEWRRPANESPAEQSAPPQPRKAVVRQIRGWSLGLTFASVALAIVLGPSPALANAIILATGWSYSLWLRKTMVSVLAPGVWFGLLPLVVTLSAPDPALAQWWVVGTGALLGVSLHFAQWWVDGDGERAGGLPALPQRVGRRTSAVLSGTALLGATTLAVVGAVLTGSVLAGPVLSG